MIFCIQSLTLETVLSQVLTNMASSTLHVLISSKRASLISDKCFRFQTNLKLTMTINNEIKTGSVSSVYSAGTFTTQNREIRNKNIFL